MAAWVTIDEARDRWRDAPGDDDYLQDLLDLAQQQVLEFGPARIATTIADDPDAVPTNYRMAQLTQARNTWNAVKSDPLSQGIGDEGFVFRPFPMDWTVKQMIRPRRAKPVVA